MTDAPSSPRPSVFTVPMSTRDPAPIPTPLPTTTSQKPSTPSFALPKLRLEIRDLNHDGTQGFLIAVVASKALLTAVQSVLSLLYKSPTEHTTTVPGTRSVTLVLRSMEGVAYTTGSELDSDHKEIHFSLDYIHKSVAPALLAHEIMGVLTHEMVHCYQYNALGTCPGGLIEGIADWVRLNSGLSPPHWKREGTGKWDAGYQHTGYFLDYLEKRYGEGLVRKLNEKLRIERYKEKHFWTELCGRPVEQLWCDYRQKLEEESKKTEEEECLFVDRYDATASGALASQAPTSTTESGEIADVSAGVV
ncbi:plant basic secretory protein [Calycina marina]|uniref:Plant basic secretory protein n=1 Tax=Calycina marina TaxID=1763456 RepID=A0A9P7Z8Z2_9HELO|nr:plant basic secretory protein [Calycina marina]